MNLVVKPAVNGLVAVVGWLAGVKMITFGGYLTGWLVGRRMVMVMECAGE